ncbi:protein ninH [Hafnia alvei]|uniref:protein ninH n=1 Tax=Hafnia alvei TaxID=569 RepID=UPI000B65755C|nr:protein ninH [Hafnia alvei]MBI0277102.1 protein ninH [Hafnia alvei]PNL03434.1 protein ninH [Hafnia alvei]
MDAKIRTIPDMLVDTYGNQSELARRLHINRETISKYLNDKEAKHHAIVNGVFMSSRGDCGKNRWGKR